MPFWVAVGKRRLDNHKALAKGQELRQAIKVVAGRDTEGMTPSEETFDAEPTSL